MKKKNVLKIYKIHQRFYGFLSIKFVINLTKNHKFNKKQKNNTESKII